MKYTTLPQLGDKVSKICLGTMTWGQQNTEAQAHEQMDFALEQGVNFCDTAEMYPSPPEDKTRDELTAELQERMQAGLEELHSRVVKSKMNSSK